MNKSTDWLSEIRQLPTNRRAVAHEPETLRYSRARTKLRYLISQAEFLGVRVDLDKENQIEIAVWAPRDSGRGAGTYGCFRIFVREGEVLSAVMFCFYDGTDQSPKLGSLKEAQSFARSEGFVQGEGNG